MKSYYFQHDYNASNDVKIMNMKAKCNTSLHSSMHPYMRDDFWQKNQFWESPLYTEKSKEYFRKWLKKITSKKKRMTS